MIHARGSLCTAVIRLLFESMQNCSRSEFDIQLLEAFRGKALFLCELVFEFVAEDLLPMSESF